MDGVEVRSAVGKGSGSFATRRFEAGEPVLDFAGPLMRRDEVPPDPDVDHYVQIGDDAFLGPSGGPDDYVNHSCDPNCLVEVSGESARLVAVRALEPGDEVTFDYSTTVPSGYSMACSCGEAACRSVVGPYATVPEPVRAGYEARGAVPEFVLRSVT